MDRQGPASMEAAAAGRHGHLIVGAEAGVAPRQQQADAVLLEEAGPLKEPDHLVAEQLVSQVVWPTAGVGQVASAEDWLASPYLDRLVARVTGHHGVPAAELPDLIQETRIASWQAGLVLPVSADLVGSIARNKAIDLVRNLARRRARRRAAGLLAATPEVDAELHHLLSLRVAALPQRLRAFYELH